MPDFRVKSNLRFNGTDYKPGDTVTMTLEQAVEAGPDVVERTKSTQEK